MLQHCERSLVVVALSRVRSLPVRRPVMAGWLVGALARPCQCRVCIRTDSLCREQHQASARLSAEQSSRSSSNSSAVAAQQRLAKLQSVCFVDIFQKEEAKCKAKLNNFCSVFARVCVRTRELRVLVCVFYRFIIIVCACISKLLLLLLLLAMPK